MMNTVTLKNHISEVLGQQGYLIQPNGLFTLIDNDREGWRKAHQIAKAERITKRESFILSKNKIASKYFVDGKDIDIEKISPRLIEVEAETEEEDLFKWWNLVWWSLPYERGYGRQMRYIVWDDYHNAPIGLIGLQSPILSWNVRDEYLSIPAKGRDYWVNQSLNAQRIGALPPYNHLLAGKLVGMLMTGNTIRKRFEEKYRDKVTLIENRVLPSELLFITTTGAYGKSSVYQRLKYKDEYVAKFIGFSCGSGTFHIPNSLYEELVEYLDKKGYNVNRGYGNGPSRKLRLIDQALQQLGFSNGATHGIKRAVYLFPLANNLNEVIKMGSKPIWMNRTEAELTEFWKNRWAIPRSKRNEAWKDFKANEYLAEVEKMIEEFKNIYKSNFHLPDRNGD